MREFELPNIGVVRISKSSNAKRMTLRVKENIPYVTIPKYSSYKAALHFVSTKNEWIENHTQQEQTFTVNSGVLFLNKEVLIVPKAQKRITTKETIDLFVINVPEAFSSQTNESQKKLKTALIRHLTKTASTALPPIVQQIAQDEGFEFSEVVVANLTSRWGSCDNKKKIKLSIYLVQLPYELIEYVIAHELTHTEHMNHSSEFKARLDEVMPDYKQRKKRLKDYTNSLILL